MINTISENINIVMKAYIISFIEMYEIILMKENTEYVELFIIVDNTKFQQGQENIKCYLPC